MPRLVLAIPLTSAVTGFTCERLALILALLHTTVHSVSTRLSLSPWTATLPAVLLPEEDADPLSLQEAPSFPHSLGMGETLKKESSGQSGKDTGQEWDSGALLPLW